MAKRDRWFFVNRVRHRVLIRRRVDSGNPVRSHEFLALCTSLSSEESGAVAVDLDLVSAKGGAQKVHFRTFT